MFEDSLKNLVQVSGTYKHAVERLWHNQLELLLRQTMGADNMLWGALWDPVQQHPPIWTAGRHKCLGTCMHRPPIF